MMGSTQETPQLKQRRASSKKSRSGCRTCRVRHVKCDETPGSCGNCTNTGRTCDYDLQRLPRLGRATPQRNERTQLVLPMKIADGVRWAITSDERRCYSYFQHHTVPTLLEIFDSPLWQELILRASISEPAVYHAVVSLSAVHQDIEKYGMALPGQDLQNDWHRFALEQCGRSFSLLSQRHLSQDPRFREIMLLCCLLFVITQLLRGRYDEAFQHLLGGLKVLNEARATGRFEGPLAQCIMAAFRSLETQSWEYGFRRDSSMGERDDQAYSLRDFGDFGSLFEARQVLDSLVRAAFCFSTQCKDLSEEDILSDYGHLHQRQLHLLSQLSRFADRFELFCSRSKLNRKGQRAADIVRLVCCSLDIPVKTALIRDDSTLEYYIPEYEKQLTMVEGILDKHPERPSVTLDTSILPPLYYAAMWCPDYSVRCRAIAALQSWPHREGAFDSNWIAFLALQRIKADLKARPQPDVLAYVSSKLPNPNKSRQKSLVYDEFSIDDALGSMKIMESWPCVQITKQSMASEDS
ncbi:Zn(II)2Cys6 transcription factor [Aspergillus puulaauensis]|uniref:Zn(2)-C6 fungal-type domain-containing protein n=1 Tax=Aspergillus puulaauensis TaxID=1220207 RepID=A0A7R7XMS2_9EURO|nr:uncharacterized protein APUU_40850S [Aspergillus puulaauensis]BCS24406.1 hypothetical protein APUU_40850S [Aspergillus puulaauensis]